MIENFDINAFILICGAIIMGLSVREERPQVRQMFLVLGIAIMFAAVYSLEAKNNRLLNELTDKLAKVVPEEH